MPISAIGASVGIASSVANGINEAVGGGGGGGAGGAAPMFNTTAGNVPNPNYTRPLGDSSIGSKAQSGNVDMPIKGGVATAKVTDAGQVPAARDSKSTTTPEYGDVWANRLSRYLDYNTRQLG